MKSAAFFSLLLLLPACADLSGPDHGSLHSILTAEESYLSSYGTYSKTLSQLGPDSSGATTAQHAGLIDSVLATGVKSGYRYTYVPGQPDRQGKIISFIVIARPTEYGRTGRRSFFADQTGLVRSTDEDRPPTANDPPFQR